VFPGCSPLAGLAILPAMPVTAFPQVKGSEVFTFGRELAVHVVIGVPPTG